VTNIGSYAFYYSPYLMGVTIPNSVISIGDHAFLKAYYLFSIAIPNSVTEIGAYAFSSCYSLTNATFGNSVTSIGADAFYSCDNLASVTIPSSITIIGGSAFSACTALMGAYFQGNAPSGDSTVFSGDNNTTVYYLPGTRGWGPTFGDCLTAPWPLPYPVILNNSPGFGPQNNGFGFTACWGTNIPVVVEACTDLANPIWFPVGTNTFTNGLSYFIDPQWTNCPTRLYRLRSP
jgi:hypothetical protein